METYPTTDLYEVYLSSGGKGRLIVIFILVQTLPSLKLVKEMENLIQSNHKYGHLILSQPKEVTLLVKIYL